ncbi:MAG: hypothetical protein U0361_25005 [Nitrospiraceae bacterium]
MSNLEPAALSPVPDLNQPLVRELETQFAALQRGANWFYWIAGLSLVNSVVAVAGGAWGFIVGLGVTQFIDAIANAAAKDLDGTAATVVKVIAFGIAVFIAMVVALFGMFANKRHGWAFIVGLGLYVLDGLLFVLVGDWLSVGFHVFAGFGIFSGYVALRKLRELQAQVGSSKMPALAASDP